MSDNIKVTVTFSRQEIDDCDPDLSYLEPQTWMGEEDKTANAVRLAAYQRDEWHMIGIRAKATICVQRLGCSTSYELTSPGLWGVESDSDESYLQSVYEEQCSVLQSDITAMGVAEFKL